MSASAIFVSIRNKATRLPGKSFLPLGGKPLVDQLISRLKHAARPSRIVITTSVHGDDAIFEEVAGRTGVECFRGSEEDKLDRYLAAMRHHGCELAAIVDGDDPLCDPGYIDLLLEAVDAGGADFGTTVDLPVGVTSNVIRQAAVERVCAMKTEHDTEVWGGYFLQTGLFSAVKLQPAAAHRDAELRLTLDYQEDYDLIRAVFDALGPSGEFFTLGEALDFIRSKPELRRMNVEAAGRYEANLKRITRIGIAGGTTA